MNGPEDRQRLIAACFEGDSAAVRALLEAEPRLSQARFEALHSTGLHIAAHRGFEALVEQLLAAGADRGARDGAFHATPAGWAHHAGHAELGAFLDAT